MPSQPSKDFILTAPCRIINTLGRISMTAADLPGESGGTYVWTTGSSKIKLVNSSGNTIAIDALDVVSANRDAEQVSVTRTGPDGRTASKTVWLTVARVSFRQSPNQLYGFDDYDTPALRNDNHICIESDRHTFVDVLIEGGVIGTDFDFSCVHPSVCTNDQAPAQPKFELKLSAASWQQNDTQLQAIVKCPSKAVFASLIVHVYNAAVVAVAIAKVTDKRSPSTFLQFPSADYASHEQAANAKLKEGVVMYKLANTANNAVLDVPFDTTNSGTLVFDINAGGGAGFQAIDAAINEPNHLRVAIVRQMRSLYYLDVAARKGDLQITVRGSNVFLATGMPLGAGATQELVDIAVASGNVATLATPLMYDHPIGSELEFPAAAWSGNPIIIAEGSTALSVAKWTILHEVGHEALNLQDVIDVDNFMHHDQGNVDHRLRYCPRLSQYSPGTTENQWETIPRPLASRAKSV